MYEELINIVLLSESVHRKLPVMPQSHCPESTPERARMNHSSWFGGSFVVIAVHSYTFE